MNTDLIFWSDQDDVWDNKKIEIMSKVMYENKCCLVYSTWKYIDANGNANDIKNSRFTNKTIIVNSQKYKMLPPILGCSLCVSKKIILKFSNELFFNCPYNSTDTILYILSMGFGKVMYVDKPLFQRRIHQNNVTTNEKNFNKKYI